MTRLSFLLIVCAVVVPSLCRQGSDDPDNDKKTRLATFDAAWEVIRDKHYDAKLKGIDWNAVRTELRAEAEKAPSDEAMREIIREMLARLGESHFALLAPEAAEDVASTDHEGRLGVLGLEVRLIDHQLMVVAVESKGPADRAGIRPGWIITSIDQKPIKLPKPGQPKADQQSKKVMQWLAASRPLLGVPGTTVVLELKDHRNETIRCELMREKEAGASMRLGFLPPLISKLDYRRVTTEGNRAIGIIRFNVWTVSIMPEFDRALDQLRDCHGIIIDLRGNPGGIGGLVMGIGGHFTPEPVLMGTLKVRGNEMQFNTNPRKSSEDGRVLVPYQGPLAVLLDETSASTSEFFAGGMQESKRARIFGQRSAGMALASQFAKLPNGDTMQYAMADFVLASGARVESHGVKPDEEITHTRAALLGGNDLQLLGAMNWINRQAITPNKKPLRRM